MGRKLDFYMLPEDEAALLAAIRKRGDVVLVAEKTTTPVPRPLAEFPKQPAREARQGLVLWNRSITDGLLITKLDDDSYAVDKASSEVIEVVPCELVDGELRSGRIWAEPRRRDERFRRPVPKSMAFLKWYESIAQWIRTHSTRDERGARVAAGARAWAEAGGKLG